MKNCVNILPLVMLLVTGLGAPEQNIPANQSTILLTGVVYDRSGAVIVTARVVAYGSDRKKHETTTNDGGIYELRYFRRFRR